MAMLLRQGEPDDPMSLLLGPLSRSAAVVGSELGMRGRSQPRAPAPRWACSARLGPSPPGCSSSAANANQRRATHFQPRAGGAGKRSRPRVFFAYFPDVTLTSARCRRPAALEQRVHADNPAIARVYPRAWGGYRP